MARATSGDPSSVVSGARSVRLNASTDASIADTTSEVTRARPDRRRSSTSSSPCAIAVTTGMPNVAPLPFRLWAWRKRSLTRSRSFGLPSRRTRPSDRLCTFSALFSRNTPRRCVRSSLTTASHLSGGVGCASACASGCSTGSEPTCRTRSMRSDSARGGEKGCSRTATSISQVTSAPGAMSDAPVRAMICTVPASASSSRRTRSANVARSASRRISHSAQPLASARSAMNS